MKKLFTLLTAATMALAANAADYTGQLSVSLAGAPLGTQESTISITEQSEGNYTLSLNNFSLSGIGGIGNIVLTDVPGTNTGGVITLQTAQTITIQAGDDPNVTMWMGPMLGPVPVSLTARTAGDNLYTEIRIDGFGGVDVVFGSNGYQMPNAGFEEFHTATFVDGDMSYSSDEPNAWHSFNSGIAAGSMASLTKLALQVGSTSIAEEARPGSTGTKSVLLQSGMVLGIQPANGTMTTGRMQAGSLMATDPANCAFLDTSSTDVDGNGDPFYTLFSGTPDSLKVWVKFKQGTLSDANQAYKYATVSAVLTDGTYYQDPEDKEYTNIAAKAQNAQIESNDFAWQQLTIPFDYDTYAANDILPKAVLITISTNAQPGVGSTDTNNPDQLLVDDMEFVYNAGLSSLSVCGVDVDLNAGAAAYDIEVDSYGITADDVVAVADGRGAYVGKTVEEAENGATVTVTVTSNDLKKVNTYTVNVKYASTGIENVTTPETDGIEAIYNINGMRVNNTGAKGLYIIRKADGTTVKKLMK